LLRKHRALANIGRNPRIAKSIKTLSANFGYGQAAKAAPYSARVFFGKN